MAPPPRIAFSNTFTFDLQRFALTGSGTETSPYTVGTPADLKEALAAGGYIQLTADISSISETLTVANGKTVYLDFNKRKLTYTGSDYLINVEDGGILNLSSKGDTSNTEIIKTTSGKGINVVSGGTLNINSTLKITATSTNSIGVNSSGTFNLNAGTIDTANSAGGIPIKIVAGTFTMENGNLKASKAFNATGAALVVNSTGANVEIKGGLVGNASSRTALMVVNEGTATTASNIEIKGGSVAANKSNTYSRLIVNATDTPIKVSGGELKVDSGTTVLNEDPISGPLTFTGGSISVPRSKKPENGIAGSDNASHVFYLDRDAIYYPTAAALESAMKAKESQIQAIVGEGENKRYYTNVSIVSSDVAVGETYELTELGKNSAVAIVVTADGTEKYYGTFASAISSAKDGETVKLSKTNQTLKGILDKYSLNKEITLDLAGNTISFQNAYFTLNEGGKLNIIDSVSGGKINVSNSQQLVTINEGGELTIDSGEIDCTGNSSVATVFGEGKATVNGGTLKTTNSFVLASNGSTSGAEITVNGGTLTSSNATAIYAPAEGKLNISGGEITGTTGVEIRAGELNVTGGTITGTGSSYSSTSNGSGSTSSGAGIAIAQHTTNKPITVNISGYNTNISGANALAVANPESNTAEETNKVAATISGGNLKSTAEATSGSSQNGNAILANNANVEITVTDGNIDGNVTVSKVQGADTTKTATTLKMQGGTTTGEVKVVQVAADSDTETKQTGDTAKEALQVTGGTYTKKAASGVNDYLSDDVQQNEDGTVDIKGAGWTARDGSDNKIFDYLVGSDENPSSLISATFSTALTAADSINSLKYDAANGKLLGIASGATYAWGNAASSIQSQYNLATFTLSDTAITVTPQTEGVKIRGTNFVGTSKSLIQLVATSSYGLEVNASLNSLTNITGGSGNDTFLAGARATTLDGGAGDDVLVGNTNTDTFVFSGGNDTFDSYTKDSDNISLASGFAPVTDGAKISGTTTSVVLTFDNSNSLTFKASEAKIDEYTYTKDYVINNDKYATLAAGVTSFNMGTVADSVNASAVTGALAITDNSSNNYIIGGQSTNTFNYNGGSDTIEGYDIDKYTINVASNLTAPTDPDSGISYDSSSNFVVGFGGSDSLTFKAATAVKLGTYYYEPDRVLVNGTRITLGSKFSDTTFNVSRLGDAYANVATINAAAVTVSGGLNITGNSTTANSIIGARSGGTVTGGDGADTLQATDGSTTLNGGAGNDSLVGSSGTDLFVYNGGTDSISGYTASDLVRVQNFKLSDAEFTSDDTNISLSFGGDDKLIFEGVCGTAISVQSGTSKNYYTYAKDYFAHNQGITLAAGHSGTFDGTNEPYATINAAAVSIPAGVSIVGNANANYIVGSTVVGGSLYGGAGNDKLVVSERGDGKNYLFKYTEGKDEVIGFAAGDSIDVDPTKITAAKASNGRLTLAFDKNSNSLMLRADDDIATVAVGNTNADYLTKDGYVNSTDLKLFASAKGKIDLKETLYSGADIASVNAESVKNQSVTLAGGTQAAVFAYMESNKKKDGFEYGGGSATITGYEGGRDRIDLNGVASLSSFTVGNGDVVLTLGDDKAISIAGAVGEEVLLRDTSKGNGYKKMVFVDNGVVQNKKKNPTMATVSAGATSYSATDTDKTSVKKIFVTDISEAANIQAGNRSNTIIDASAATQTVSLSGGAKNDKLIGSTANADMFIYGAGKDVIQNFGGSDQISLTGGLDESLASAKITAGKKAIKFKFGNKDVLTIKSNDTMSGALTINGTEKTYFKNAIGDSTGSVSLTSGFSGTFKTQDSKRTLSAVTYVDGAKVEKNLTFVGSSANETLIGGDKKKTMFKGGGGDDSLVAGTGKDTFFYAKGNEGNATISKFEFGTDKLKVASGILGNVEKSSNAITFGMTKGKSTDAVVGSFIVDASTATNGNIAIKANNTFYWFAEGTETLESGDNVSVGQLITSDTKISAPTGYDVIDLNYSTNLVKSGVAIKVTGAKPK